MANITLILTRTDCGPDGIFSTLTDESGSVIAYTAEHAYDSFPKLPNGTFTVLLGTHTLDHGGPQQLFCVQGVEGHSGICFHKGNNPQIDSDGCILLGAARSGNMVVKSEVTFDLFMKAMTGVDAFDLTVVGQS